jgi:hypothetical protein
LIARISRGGSRQIPRGPHLPGLRIPAFQTIDPPNFFRALNFSSAIVFLAASALAIAAPEWQDGVSSPAFGSHPRLEPISLDYQVSWKGVLNSGHLHLEFAPPWDRKAGAYVVKAHAVSQGAAAAVHPYTFNSWSELSPATLAPRYVRAEETDKNGGDLSEIRYFSNRVETDTTIRSAATGKSKIEKRTFTFPAVFDMFSAMLYIRSQPLKDGDKIQLVIQSGDQPYLLHVRCVRRETHEGQKTIRLAAGMDKIDRDSFELKPYKKLRNDATLWLSDDPDRIPLEFRADIFLGDVRAVLTSRKKL